MKRKHLAVAVSGALAALAAPASFAQSTVSISGHLDVAATSSIVNNVKLTSMHSGLNSPSRITFSGSEDLGGGLKAKFEIQTGLAATTQLTTSTTGTTASNTNYVISERTSTALGDRGIYVGLEGPFGEVNAGRLGHVTGAFAIGMQGVQNALASAVGGGTAHPGQNADVVLSSQSEGRANQAFRYNTPRVSGLQGTAFFALGGGNGDGAQGNRTTWVGDYTQGPLQIQLMSSTRKAYVAGVITDTGQTPTQMSSYSAFLASNDVKERALGVKYNMGVVVLGVGNAKQTTLPGTNQKASGYSVGVPLGAWTLAAGYASITPSSGAGYKSGSLSAQYAMSKRTQVYAARRSNNQESTSTTTGAEKLSLVGVLHSF